MPSSSIRDFQRYENGKQAITLIVNVFILAGFVAEIISFYRIYVPLQLYLQIFSVLIYIFSLLLLVLNRQRYYSIIYLLITYFLLANIIIYDVFFPEFISQLHFMRSEFFSRNLFILLPFIAIVGFISGKQHIIFQGSILLLYVGYQFSVNNDSFLHASLPTYFLSVIGFSSVSYFLVNANQSFIKDLHDTNLKLKETQQHLIQSEKMASVGTLIAGVAHEINNPLNFINGGIEMIADSKDEMQHEIPAEFLERLNISMEMINTGFERSNKIVQALMSFSGRGSSVQLSSNINEIIDNTLLFLKTKIPTGIDITKIYQCNRSVNVYRGKIHQVIASIIENAVYALNQTKKPAKIIEISTREENSLIIIQISNNGPGIEEQNLNQIFDPFFTTKDTGQGTGLGLSLSYALIQEHEGKIYARNTNEGVTFIIELPI